jgi:hypothetical protein
MLLDGAAQHVEVLTPDRVRLLVTDVAEQGGRAHQVGEEDRDEALAHEDWDIIPAHGVAWDHPSG